MYLAISLTGIAAFCPRAAAQTYVTSPAGFARTEGSSNAYGLGTYPDGRFMYCDGEYRGTPMTVKGTAYRPDNFNFPATSNGGQGRSWTSVQVHASECDIATFDRTFDNNPTTTPTLVFSSSITWPSLVGKPAKFPADWSVQFPFSTSWAYTGNQDICLDYRFAGGTLANSGSWTGAQAQYYYMDAEDNPTSVSTTSTNLGRSGNGVGCNDRGVTHTQGATVTLRSTLYNRWYSSANNRDHLVFTQTGNYFGISRATVTILGFRPVPNGVPFPGVTCNKVHIDLSLPTLQYLQITNTSGSLPSLTFGAGATGFPVPGNFGGIDLVSQAGWTDAQTGQLLLSDAAHIQIPSMPTSYDRTVVYTWNPTATVGSVNNTDKYNPIVRFAR